MSLDRIFDIKVKLPQEINLYFTEYNTSQSVLPVSLRINYKCSVCKGTYRNAITYCHNSGKFRCLNCLTVQNDMYIRDQDQKKYNQKIKKMVTHINNKYGEHFKLSLTTTYPSDVSERVKCNGCSGIFKDKKINGYRFTSDNENTFLCFMCYCNYRKNTKMSMSRKTTSTRKRVNKKAISTRKRVNKKAISTRKRNNKNSKSTGKK